MTRGLLSEFLAKRRTTHCYSFSKRPSSKSNLICWVSVSSILQTVGGGGVGLLWNWVEEEIFSSWKFSLQQHCRVSFELSPTLRVHQHRLPCVVSEYVENIYIGVNWRSKWRNISKRVRVFQKDRKIVTNPISFKTEMHFKLQYPISHIRSNVFNLIKPNRFKIHHSLIWCKTIWYIHHISNIWLFVQKKSLSELGCGWFLARTLEPFSPIGANRYLLISLISHQNLQHF